MRPAIEVWEDAFRAWDDAPINPDRIGDDDRAAIAVIEADRAEARAELVAEIAAELRDQYSGRLQSPIFLADHIEAKFGGRDG